MPLGIISIFMEQRGTIIMPGIWPMPMPGIDGIPTEFIMPPIIGFTIPMGIIIMEPIGSDAPEPIVIPRPLTVSVMLNILSVRGVPLISRTRFFSRPQSAWAVQVLHTLEIVPSSDKAYL